MTTFHRWDDVKREIFDEEDIAAIDEGSAPSSADAAAATRAAVISQAGCCP
ncbi:hypothetical protein [Streptosporangium sp. NPDC049046]|uniref:hypothetical protein n=1 Tax=unclassified Streptosporangium TaxID=2632669 RepID=UPI00344879ED